VNESRIGITELTTGPPIIDHRSTGALDLSCASTLPLTFPSSIISETVSTIGKSRDMFILDTGRIVMAVVMTIVIPAFIHAGAAVSSVLVLFGVQRLLFWGTH